MLNHKQSQLPAYRRNSHGTKKYQWAAGAEAIS